MSFLMRVSGKKLLLLAIFGLFAFLPLALYVTSEEDCATSIEFSNMTKYIKCIFCDIAAGKVPQTKLERETEDYVIFKDIKPASTHHYLAVSKRHIENVKKLTKADDDLLVHMETGLKEFFKSQGIDTKDALFGFHLPPFISVKHLHMHGIAPHSTMSLWQSFMFRPGSAWFKTVNDTRQMIKERQT